MAAITAFTSTFPTTSDTPSDSNSIAADGATSLTAAVSVTANSGVFWWIGWHVPTTKWYAIGSSFTVDATVTGGCTCDRLSPGDVSFSRFSLWKASGTATIASVHINVCNR